MSTSETPVPESQVSQATKVLEALQAKRTAIAERIEVNKQTRAKLAFEAHTEQQNGKAKSQLADLSAEAIRLVTDTENIASAIAEAERRLAEAKQEQAIEDERQRAQAARDHFDAIVEAFGTFKVAVHTMFDAYQAARKSLVPLRDTGFGPQEAQITRWAQRYIVWVCQHDRTLQMEDMMADSREKQWLQRAPHDWLAKIAADTGKILDDETEEAA